MKIRSLYGWVALAVLCSFLACGQGNAVAADAAAPRIKEVKEVYIDKDGGLDGYEVRLYNPKGDITKRSTYNAKKKLQYYIEYVYDSHGYLIMGVAKNSYHKILGYGKVTPDYRGNPAEVRVYDSSNKMIEHISYRWIYAFDSAGELYELSYRNGSDVLIYQKFYEYNLVGELVMITTYGGNGLIIISDIYEYRSDGLAREMFRYDWTLGETILSERYRYNKEGRLILYTGFDMDGHRLYSTVVRYNKEGFVKSYTYFSGTGLYDGAQVFYYKYY